jgi:hypothetical protein
MSTNLPAAALVGSLRNRKGAFYAAIHQYFSSALSLRTPRNTPHSTLSSALSQR